MIYAIFAKVPRWASIAIAAALLVLATFIVARCTGGKDTSQAEQTTRSGEAISNAAQGAIKTIGDRTVTDKVLENAASQAAEDVESAQSAAEIRSTVKATVCGQNVHRNDPGCK